MQSKESIIRGSSFMDGEKAYIWFGLHKETVNVGIFLTRNAKNEVKVEDDVLTCISSSSPLPGLCCKPTVL